MNGAKTEDLGVGFSEALPLGVQSLLELPPLPLRLPRWTVLVSTTDLGRLTGAGLESSSWRSGASFTTSLKKSMIPSDAM